LSKRGKKAVQQFREMTNIQELPEDKDYIYINAWSLLAAIGAGVACVLNFFGQSFDNDTILTLALIACFFMAGSGLCICLAIKRGARQTPISALFSFFLILLSVTIGMVAVYDNNKTILVFSLLLAVPVGLFSILPSFYYGDHRELEPFDTGKNCNP
jgi:drug/metabolite transporter (DMT)-like permease